MAMTEFFEGQDLATRAVCVAPKERKEIEWVDHFCCRQQQEPEGKTRQHNKDARPGHRRGRATLLVSVVVEWEGEEEKVMVVGEEEGDEERVERPREEGTRKRRQDQTRVTTRRSVVFWNNKKLKI